MDLLALWLRIAALATPGEYRCRLKPAVGDIGIHETASYRYGSLRQACGQWQMIIDADGDFSNH